ncbi:Nuclease S1 [Durusdinium trenchii]|uniref:Nuclease S1 n=1 Tax=Durusdinium trenchii TaxID=1381693 RepID=A0ABP0QEY6_9DINO
MDRLAEQAYGAEVKLVFRGEQYTLLQFWEEYLPKHLPEIPQISTLDLEYGAQYHQWGDRLPPELFREWGGEMSEQVCNEIYGPMYVNHGDGSRSIESPFQLSEELFSRWTKLAEKLIHEGGERLALVFLDIIEHRRHKAAQKEGRGLLPPLVDKLPPASVAATLGGKGTPYTVPAPVVGGHQHLEHSAASQMRRQHLHRIRRRRAWRNLTTNLFIAAVVVPLLLFGLHAHSRSPGSFTRIFLKKDNS